MSGRLLSLIEAVETAAHTALESEEHYPSSESGRFVLCGLITFTANQKIESNKPLQGAMPSS
jgi:hypothetical protein